MGIGSDIYSGLSSIGRVESILSAVIVVAIAIIFIAIGVSLIRTPYTAVTMATIQSVQCSASSPNDSASSCELAITYVVNGVTYNNHVQALSDTPSEYATGKSVSIRYDPANPENAMVGVNEHTMGYIMIGIAVLISIVAIANAYLTTQSKAYAAVSGAGDVVRGIESM